MAMATERYEGILRAAMKGENALWEIGDEIVKVTGASRVTPGKNDSSRNEIALIKEELASNGIEQYTVEYLSQLRTTSIIFQPSDRIKSVSHTAHRHSGSPETLRAAIDYAKHTGVRFSTRMIAEFKKQLADEEKKARKEARQDALEAKKAAEAEAQKAKEDKRAANSREAKEAAAKREQEAKERAKEAARLANDLKSPPPINHSAPKKGPADVPMLVVRTTFNADVEKAKTLARKMDRDIAPHLENLSDAFVANAVEELLEVANSYRQLSNKIRSGKVNKRAHLYAVGE